MAATVDRWWESLQQMAHVEAGSVISRLLGTFIVLAVMLLMLPVLGRVLGWVVTLGLRYILQQKSFSLAVGALSIFPFRLVDLHVRAPVWGPLRHPCPY